MRLESPGFLDREDQLGEIGQHLDALRRDATHFKIVEVLGLGGMGKTSLLEQLWLQAVDAADEGHVLWVSLEAEATSHTGPLLVMRDQLDFACLLFDTALLAYWNAVGQPLQLPRSARLSDSLVVQALELGGGFAGFALPIGFGLAVYEALRRTAVKREQYRREEFEEIERLHKRPRDLAARLPYYLAVDVARSVEASGRSVLMFYDAYDRQTAATRDAQSPWMREFIGTLRRGVHVVSTREPLRWTDATCGPAVVEVSVDALPDQHARAMVRSRLGGLSLDTEARLVAAARRIPFLLDTVINGYAEIADGGRDVRVDQLPSSPDSGLAQFVAHLPDAQRQLAVALATVQVFDEQLFQHVIRALNIQVSFQTFHRFVDWYFVEPVAVGAIYKTHDLLTAFVRESPTVEDMRVAALEAATQHLLDRCLAGGGLNPDGVLPILRAVLAGWYSTPRMRTSSVEILVDVGFLLYDAGYWNELAALGSEGSPDGAHPADVLLEFFLALTGRRIVGIRPALTRFAALIPRAARLGRHELAVELEAAYVKGLAGDYRHAREDFRRIARRPVRLDPTDRTQMNARLYHSDMLLMDGAFRQSSRLLLETYEATDPSTSPNWGEFVRHRGHAHRFSFALEQAEELYLRALSVTDPGRAPALVGRLHTNLAESYCWSDPRRALDAADAAVKVHSFLGNRIELAKCDAARGIALAKLGEADRAVEAISGALRRAEDVGYQAGVAFALQAAVVAACLAGDHDAASFDARRLALIVRHMGTYRHLRVVPCLLLGGDAEFASISAQTEWLIEEPIRARIAAYLART